MTVNRAEKQRTCVVMIGGDRWERENWRDEPGLNPAASISQTKEFELHPKNNQGPFMDFK